MPGVRRVAMKSIRTTVLYSLHKEMGAGHPEAPFS